VPRVTFTWPQVASVGLTEAQAKEAGHNIAISILPLEQVPRALVNQQTSGIVKLVADATSRRLLGAHIVAENAGDVIYAATIAIRLGATLSDITTTFAPYLTMAEALKLAAQGFEMDVSRLSCCAG
jgi:mercuric reductase